MRRIIIIQPYHRGKRTLKQGGANHTWRKRKIAKFCFRVANSKFVFNTYAALSKTYIQGEFLAWDGFLSRGLVLKELSYKAEQSYQPPPWFHLQFLVCKLSSHIGFCLLTEDQPGPPHIALADPSVVGCGYNEGAWMRVNGKEKSL